MSASTAHADLDLATDLALVAVHLGAEDGVEDDLLVRLHSFEWATRIDYSESNGGGFFWGLTDEGSDVIGDMQGEGTYDRLVNEVRTSQGLIVTGDHFIPAAA